MSAYLKYGDIKGDVKEPAHRSWIELTSVGLPFSSPSGLAVNYHTGGKANEVMVTKGIDQATPALVQQASAGKPVPAVIDLVRAGGSVTFRIEMSGALISSYYSTSSNGNAPSEALTLNCAKIEYKSEPGAAPR